MCGLGVFIICVNALLVLLHAISYKLVKKTHCVGPWWKISLLEDL